MYKDLLDKSVCFSTKTIMTSYKRIKTFKIKRILCLLINIMGVSIEGKSKVGAYSAITEEQFMSSLRSACNALTRYKMQVKNTIDKK